MASEIKLNHEDIEALKKRLTEQGLEADEKELIEALLKMAKNHPAPGGTEPMWFFNWRDG
jgi:hypothetical protein